MVESSSSPLEDSSSESEYSSSESVSVSLGCSSFTHGSSDCSSVRVPAFLASFVEFRFPKRISLLFVVRLVNFDWFDKFLLLALCLYEVNFRSCRAFR